MEIGKPPAFFRGKTGDWSPPITSQPLTEQLDTTESSSESEPPAFCFNWIHWRLTKHSFTSQLHFLLLWSDQRNLFCFLPPREIEKERKIKKQFITRHHLLISCCFSLLCATFSPFTSGIFSRCLPPPLKQPTQWLKRSAKTHLWPLTAVTVTTCVASQPLLTATTRDDQQWPRTSCHLSDPDLLPAYIVPIPACIGRIWFILPQGQRHTHSSLTFTYKIPGRQLYTSTDKPLDTWANRRELFNSIIHYPCASIYPAGNTRSQPGALIYPVDNFSLFHLP